MRKYRIKMELQSETMFGSGQSIPGVIDTDIQYDEYGLPYMHAKTLKGHIGEQMRWIVDLKQMDTAICSRLLGSPDTEGDKTNGKLHFGNVRLSHAVEARLMAALEAGLLSKEELLESLTVSYSFTSLDDEGIAKDHTLRRVRMLRKGLVFEADIHAEELMEAEEGLLYAAVGALQHVGSYKSKGKGLVRCELEEASDE